MIRRRSTPGPRYQPLLSLLHTAEAVWESSRVFFARWDLSPSQFNVLNLLYGSPDGLTQTDLSKRLITHRSNITGLVDRLEARGFLQRNEAREDRRAYRVVLTPKGRSLVQEILPYYYSAAETVWDGVEPGQVKALTGSLDRLARNANLAASQMESP